VQESFVEWIEDTMDRGLACQFDLDMLEKCLSELETCVDDVVFVKEV